MQAAEQHKGLARRRDYTDELLRAFPGSHVVNPEGSVIDLPFQLPTGRPTALRVSLPAHFPHDRPVICVLVPLQHPAVDPTGRVLVRGLQLWGAAQGGVANHPQRGGNILPPGTSPADLLAVVQEAFAAILGEVTATKQGLLGGPNGGRSSGGGGGPGSLEAHMISLGGGWMGGRQVYYDGGVAARSDDPAEFLEALPLLKLQELLENESELRKAAATWLKDTPAARALEDVRRQNYAAAEDNIALSRSIEEARGHVAIVRSGDYASTRALFEELYRRQEAVLAKMGLTRVLARLREEADKSDAAADDLLERYQEGKLSVESFVEQYVTLREAFHITDLKRQAAEHTALE